MTKEFNLSDKIQGVDEIVIGVLDVKEFIKRRIERTRMIIKMYPHKHGEELAGQINEDLVNDAGDKLTK